MLASSSVLLRRSAVSGLAARNTNVAASAAATSSLFDASSSSSSFLSRRWKSSDAGDVIGIDLGTTNSCVAIMVRRKDYQGLRGLVQGHDDDDDDDGTRLASHRILLIRSLFLTPTMPFFLYSLLPYLIASPASLSRFAIC